MPANAKTVLSAAKVKRVMGEIARRTGSSQTPHNQEAHMICAAVPPGDKPEEIIVASSGSVNAHATGSATDPFPAYLREYRTQLPWRDLPTPPNRSFYTCAEAHVWLELRGRGKDPKHYYLVSFNNFGQVASPCENCSRWVDKAFAYVHRETRSYEGHPKQRPDYRQNN